MQFLSQIHPIVVHFPLALLITYVILEVLGLLLRRKSVADAAFIVLIVGVVSAFFALLTGNQAEEIAEKTAAGAQAVKQIMEEHENWASTSMWYFTGIMILRVYHFIQVSIKKKSLHWLSKLPYAFAVLGIIGVFFLFKTGLYGGELVYKYGVGTSINNSGAPVQTPAEHEASKKSDED